MALTNSQKEEIDFFSLYAGIQPDEKEIQEYIQMTVLGTKKSGKEFEKNTLFQAKRSLDINMKMWREDLTLGLLSIEKLQEDDWGKHPYFQKMLSSLMKGITKEYRMKTFEKNKVETKDKDGKVLSTSYPCGTVLAFTNFPNVTEALKK